MDFLPKHFGARAMIKFEMSVYDWMGSLCPTYRGGFWNYVELSNGGAFMYPAGVDAFEFTVDGNGFTAPSVPRSRASSPPRSRSTACSGEAGTA
jgi:hypothetical protein